MTFRMSRLHFALLACLLTGICSGQTPTGVPPFASTSGSSFDTVNNGNLNVHLLVPMVHKAGRGTSFDYLLSYDTSVWYPTGSSGHQNWTPVSNWGWRAVTEAETGYATASRSTQTCPNVKGGTTTYFQFTWIAYHDRLGVAHAMTNITNSAASQLCVNPPLLQDTETAKDGSGLTFTATEAQPLIVTPPSGKNYTAPVFSGTGAGSFTDENGNQITATYNSTSGTTSFTDTLGTTALSTSGSGTPTSPIQYTYTSPAGTSVSYVLNYTQYTIKTNFNCGIAEYGPTSVNLVSSIALPDNSSYTFAYEATPGYAGDVTGRLASVTLPTGGTITYGYTGGNNGIVCADGSAAGLSRATPDGTWTYTRSQVTGHWQTTINDPTTPTANQTVIAFQQDSASTANSSNFYETQRLVYQGSASGTPLSTTITCYNGNSISSPSNCPSTTVSTPIKRQTIFSYLPNASGQQSETDVTYDSGGLGLVTEVDSYDFASAKVGSLIQKVITTYGSYSAGTCTALGNGIVNRPCTIAVTDGGGNTQAKTTYSYDQTTPSASSGTPQHISISGSRGNVTTIAYTTLGSSTISRSFTYWDTGNINVATDVNLAQTTYNYPDATSTCGNTFPTSVSLPLGLSTSTTWNCTGAVATQVKDLNGNPTKINYTDAKFWRPANFVDPLTNTTNLTYTGQTVLESSLSFNSGNSVVDVRSTIDGLGRPILAQRLQTPGGSNYDSVETDYDIAGRVSRVTMPFSATAGTTNSTAPGIKPTYDALGRVLTLKDANGGTASYSYTNNDVLQKISGTQTFQKQFEYDALGRLTSVCEISSTLPGVGTCAQSNSQTGYWTKYTYDALSRLTQVQQNTQGSPVQTRSYAYDGLSRLTSEANSESGTVNYIYDVACTSTPASAGDMTKRVDNAGNVTCYNYDALHRLTDAGLSGPTCRRFRYDNLAGPPPSGVTVSNTLGRLESASTDNCGSGAPKITDEWFSYDADGRLTDVYEKTPNSGGYYHVNALYWANGSVNTLNGYLASGSTFFPQQTYGLDGEGRVTKVTAGSGQNPVTGVTYTTSGTTQPIGSLTNVTFGSGDSDNYSYDPNTGRMKQYKFTMNGQSEIGNLGWNANGTLGTLGITDPFNSSDAQSCTFSYDDLARVSSQSCGSVWSQTFTYDAFGNIKKTGSISWQPGYNSATNQYNSLPGFTPTYDANGNLTADSFHTYAWDPNWGTPTSIDTIGLTYDALNRMVEQNKSGTYYQIVYAPWGKKLAVMSGQTLQQAFVPLPGAAMAEYLSWGLSHYRHPDWLGSDRLASSSTTSNTPVTSAAYAAFGEPYATSGNGELSFTGQNKDTVYVDYDFLYREYDPKQGRWISPDPAGLDAVDPTNPQTWNRYSYVGNNPLSAIDPLGLGDPNANPNWGVGCRNSTNQDPRCKRSGGDQLQNPGSQWDPFSLIGIPVTVWTPGENGDASFWVPVESAFLFFGDTLGGGDPATNCTPGTPGCFNVPANNGNCGITVKCRGIEYGKLGKLGFQHCDAQVTDSSGAVWSLSGGPQSYGDITALNAWATSPPADPFTGTTVYQGNSCSAAGCMIQSTQAWNKDIVKPIYSATSGPNSNTWLKGTAAGCGVSLPINTWGPIW